MRARIYFGLFLIGLGATGTALTGGDVRATLADGFRNASADLSLDGWRFWSAGEDPTSAPKRLGPAPDASTSPASDPLGAFLATARAIVANDPEALIGHATPRDALSTPLGGGGAGTMHRVAPPQGSDPASMEQAMRALTRSFGTGEESASSAPVPVRSTPSDTADARTGPVILRPGGGSSDGLPQIGR